MKLKTTYKLFIFILYFVPLFFTFSESNQSQEIKLGNETVSFFDGSSLIGNLDEINQEQDLIWNHKSSQNPLIFDYKAVDSISFNRTAKEFSADKVGRMRVHFRNHDFLLGTILSMDNQNLIFSTGFEKEMSVQLNHIQSLEFLPESYKVLYDSSYEFEKWKKSNSKAWTEEKGSLISVFSGSTGTTLPELDAIEVTFQAEWQRSFYLALRFFSDSDGGSYGSEGYHLSFSNNRINLQSNRKVKGRTIRETLGSILVDAMVGVKKADFKISAHRKRKEFVVNLNGQEVARWKDSGTDSFSQNNGLLFINQGGNSYLRLKELSIAGWQGDYFTTPPLPLKNQPQQQFIAFKNGDSTPVISSQSTPQGLTIKTSRGAFTVPYQNIKSLTFRTPEIDRKTENESKFSEQIILKRSLGKLSFAIQSIDKNSLHGNNHLLGDFSIPVHRIKRLHCNMLIKLLKEYLAKIKSAEQKLKAQDSETALSILEDTNPLFRSWYWARLKFLAQDFETSEILWFNPHPDSGVSRAVLCEKNENTIFTNSKEGSYALWDGHAKLAEGNFTHTNSGNGELGRLKNEKWKKIHISNSFWLGKTEVTQTQFEKIMGNNPSKTKGENLPVQTNWLQATEFCEKLTKKIKPPLHYIWRLPTEAEWEYACRAGSSGPYCDSKDEKFSYIDHLRKYAWFSDNSNGRVQPVGGKSPNAWGLHDMHGNVWEWCADGTTVNKTSLFELPKFGSYDPVTIDGEWRILKGGTFATDYTRCRAAYRGGNSPTVSIGDRGFRVCLGPPLAEGNQSISKNSLSIKEQTALVSKISPFPMMKIPEGSFMMGSRDTSNTPMAVCNLNEKLIISGDNLGKVSARNIGEDHSQWEIDLNGSMHEIKIWENKHLAVMGTDVGSVHIFNYKTKKIIKNFYDHSAPISSLAIDQKGESFVSCGLDGKLVFRTLNQDNPKWILLSHQYEGNIEYVEYSHDSKNLLCSGFHSNVQTIELNSGTPKTIFKKEKGKIIIAKWLPQMNYCSILHPNGLLSLVEPKSGMIYKLFRLNLPSTIDFDFSKDGQKILLTTEKGSCSLRDLPNGFSIVIISPKGEEEKTPDFYFNLTKQTSFEIPELRLFLAQYRETKNDQKGFRSLAYSPCNQLTATTHDGALRLWRTENGQFMGTIAKNLASNFFGCSFSKDGASLVGKLESGHTLIYGSNRKFINNSGKSTDSLQLHPFIER